MWTIVTVSVGGTATKVRFWTDSAGIDVKMALYSSGGVLLANGTGTSVSAGWTEVTLGIPVAVTATDYIVAFQSASEITSKWIAPDVSKFGITAYADFPTATLESPNAFGGTLGFGIYVD